MNFLIKKHRWLYVSLSIFSLCLVVAMTPVKASVQSPTTTLNAQATNSLEQGRNFFHSGRFTEAATAWQGAVQYYHNQGDRLNEALSLNYLSLAQQELN